MAGDWKVVDSCVQMGGLADISAWGLACRSVPVSGVLKVRGSFSVSASGALIDATRTAGNVQFDFSSSCLVVSGVPVSCEAVAPLLEAWGYRPARCTDLGKMCVCEAMTDQTGSMGIISDWPVTNGSVFLENPVRFKTTSDGFTDPDYLFCASEDRLVAMPSPVPSQGLTGAIVLERR